MPTIDWAARYKADMAEAELAKLLEASAAVHRAQPNRQEQVAAAAATIESPALRLSLLAVRESSDPSLDPLPALTLQSAVYRHPNKSSARVR